MAGRSDQIRALLTGAERAMSCEEIHAQTDGEPGEEKKTSALLTYLRTQGQIEIAETIGRVAYWRMTGAAATAPAAEDAESAPPPKAKRAKRVKAARTKAAPKARRKTKRARRALVLAARPRTRAPAIEPPGSMAIADDGAVLLLEGDLVAARLTRQQVINVVALAERFGLGR